MAACTRCGFQLNGTQTHCEHCGMFLPALAVYNPAQPEYDVPPQAISYQEPKFVAAPPPPPTTSSLIRGVQTFFAFIGLCIAAFGAFSSLSEHIDVGIAFLLGLAILVGGLIYACLLLFVKKMPPHLRQWQRLVGWVVASFVCVVMLFATAILFQASKPAMGVSFGTTFFLYGLVLATLAVW